MTNFYSAGFGPARSGLANVGLTAYSAGGAVAVARQVATELKTGSGDYGRSIILPDSFAGYLEWDSGEASPIYLHENVNLSPAASGISKADVTDALTTQGLTTARAALLDNLDAKVSTRSTLSATDVWAAGSRSLTTFGSLPDNAAAAVWAYLNRTITGGGGITSADLASALNTQGLTTQRAAKLDNLDAAITTRNATAPDNASIAAIKLKTDAIPSNPAAAGSKMLIDLNQLIPNDLGTGTVGEAMQAARAQGYGSWKIVGNALKLYAADNITVLKTFALDSASNPTSRTAQ